MSLMPRTLRPFLLLLASALAQPLAAETAAVAIVKRLAGAVTIERDGAALDAQPGMTLAERDVVVTGAGGSAGITFADNSLLSVGPNSRLVIERFQFDSTTHAGVFETALDRGRMAVVSGKIAKQSPEPMTVRTPRSILGVRGTEFVVEAGAPP